MSPINLWSVEGIAGRHDRIAGATEAGGLRIVTVGEILWDVIGEHEYLGGAPLNFAAHAQKLGHEAFLVSAVGDDDRGRRTLDRLRQWGLSTEFVQVLQGKDTGTAQVELDRDGKPTFRIVRPAAYDFVTSHRRTTAIPLRIAARLDLLRHAVSHVGAGAGFDAEAATGCAFRSSLLRCQPARGQLEPRPGGAAVIACRRHQVERQRSGVSRWIAQCRRRRGID